ncbi:MAG: hypothetical protein WBA51_07955 [Erythrobacter sp.]
MPAYTIPPFHPVPVRSRSDGWTPERQARFIGHLAETHSVARAARAVGMAREGAYRLRSRAWSHSFCLAWNAALGKQAVPALTPAHAKVTLEELEWQFESGLWHVVMRRGKFWDLRWKPCNSAFFAAASRVGMLNRAPIWPKAVAALGDAMKTAMSVK